MCAPRHANKGMLETLSLVEDEHALLSRFNLETYASVVDSPRLPQIVPDLSERDDDVISVDVIRCRFNALTEQESYDLPVFCPADNIVAATNELSD